MTKVSAARFKSKDHFIRFLETTLIPDLKKSGRDGTMRDFKKLVTMLKSGKPDAKFIRFLETTLIPDLKKSGEEFTADDFEIGLKFLRSDAVKDSFFDPKSEDSHGRGAWRKSNASTNDPTMAYARAAVQKAAAAIKPVSAAKAVKGIPSKSKVKELLKSLGIKSSGVYWNRTTSGLVYVKLVRETFVGPDMRKAKASPKDKNLAATLAKAFPDAQVRLTVTDNEQGTAKVVAIRLKATEDKASASSVSAAKDIGDKGGDKGRRKQLATVVKTAADICKEPALSELSEVQDICGQVASLGELSKKLDDRLAALKSAKSGDETAIAAQKELDGLRVAIDTMLPAIAANLEVLRKVGTTAGEEIAAEAKAKKAFEAATANAKTAKARLASAIQAVKNSLKVG